MASHTKGDLEQLQALPLDKKVILSKQRIKQWYEYWDGNVFISFSGGKDSTVLKHLVDSMYDDVPAVFVNTGLEFMDIQSFARKAGAEFVRPKMNFRDVITTYGYPIISKEVAEAIYYARRIRPYDVPTDRERERERENWRSQENRATRKPRKLYPDRGGGCKQGSGLSCSETLPLRGRQYMAWQQTGNPTRENARSRGEWADWRRGCL